MTRPDASAERMVAHETSAGMDRRVDLYRTLVGLVTRLDPWRANRPVSPDAIALTH